MRVNSVLRDITGYEFSGQIVSELVNYDKPPFIKVFYLHTRTHLSLDSKIILPGCPCLRICFFTWVPWFLMFWGFFGVCLCWHHSLLSSCSLSLDTMESYKKKIIKQKEIGKSRDVAEVIFPFIEMNVDMNQNSLTAITDISRNFYIGQRELQV